MRPSLLISSLSAILAVIAVYLSFTIPLNTKETIQILLLASIAFGIHSLQHAHDEIYYDFNPLVPGKFQNVWRDDPIIRSEDSMFE
jgi:hypothetical protein